MPNRPREHQLEDESRIAFEAALGGAFKYRTEAATEYGIDGTVECFDASGRATGIRFHVQLKATDETDPRKALAVSLRRDTVAYLRSQALPTLMVRFCADAGALYARWLHQFALPGADLAQKTSTLRWAPDDRLTTESRDRLATEATAFLNLRSPALHLPVELYLHLDGVEGIAAMGTAALRFALRTACEQASVFSFRSAAPPPAAFRVVVDAEDIVVDLAGVTSAGASHPKVEPNGLGDAFAGDAMVLAAVAFARIGRTDAATALATPFFAASRLSADADAAWSLASAFQSSRRIREAFQLAEELDVHESGRDWASMAFLLAGRWHVPSWTEPELDEYVTVMERRVARRLERHESHAAGRESYNLANVLRSRRRPAAALGAYNQARSLEPEYENRAYFHEERAGVLFSLGRFGESAEVYGRAEEIEPDPKLIGLRADALMFAGRYADALATFEEFGRSGADEAEWRIKERFTRSIVSGLGISTQTRDTSAAVAAVDLDYSNAQPEQLAEKLSNALRLDALLPVAWFNLGRAQLDQGDDEAALIAYVGAAASQRVDGEAWLNVVILALTTGDVELTSDALECGMRAAPEDFRSRTIEWSTSSGGVNSEWLLHLIDEVSEALAANNRTGMLVRLHDDQGGIDEAVLDQVAE